MRGLHVAEQLPTATQENAGREEPRLTARSWVACPGTKVPMPPVAVAGPDQ